MKKILIVEDEPTIFSRMVQMLLLRGFNVYGATDVGIGLLLSETIQPDLILCDIKQPAFKNLAILEHVRKNSKTASIPFIILTGQTDQEVHQRCLKLGASELLSESISPDVLLTVVNHQLVVAAS